MRRLNFKLFLGLVVVCLSLAGGVHVVHRLQSNRTSRALLQQADRAEKAGDRAKAARYMERYLKYAPGDAGAQIRFGKLVLPEDPGSAPGDALSAVKAFEKALTLDPELKEYRRKTADVFMKLGRSEDYGAALVHLDVLVAAEPHNGELLSLRGRCLEELGRYDAAAAAYRQARREDPHRVEAYARLAGLLRRRLGRPGEADRVMDAVKDQGGVVASNGRSAEAYVARARYRKEYKLAGFDGDAGRALELAPDDADAILVAAEAAADGDDKGWQDRARALLERGVKAHPRDLRMYLALASAEASTGRAAGVISALERGVKVFPGRIDLLWQLADARVSGGKLAEAGEVLKQLRGGVDRLPPETRDWLATMLRYEDARLLMARNRWAEAAAAMERAASDLKAPAGSADLAKRAFLQLGQCYAALGNADKQFAAYRQAASIILPSAAALDLAAHLGLAEALAARSKYDEAALEYRRVLTLPGAPPEVRASLARLYVLRELRAPETRRRWTEAEQALGEAERALPGSPEVALLRGELLLATGKPGEAGRAVRRVREKSPDRVSLWAAEAELAFRAGKADEALRLLDEAEARLGRLPALSQARAVLLARRGGPKAVESLAAIEASAAGLADADRRRLLNTLANAYALAGDAARSRRLLRQLADEEPANLNLRLALFEKLLNDGEETEAGRLLGEIRRLDAEGSQALVAEAVLITRKAAGDRSVSLDPARRLLGQAARLRPDWPAVPLSEARIDEMQGQRESALANYLRAIELGDTGPLAVLRATQILSETGRYDQADQVFQRLQGRTALTGDQQRMAADLALRSRDYDRALAQARAAVSADRNDFRNPLFLGRILYALGRVDESEGRASVARMGEAERSFRRSLELAGDDPTPRVELVRFLAATGRKPEATGLTRAAGKTAKTGREFLALGQCYEAVGDAAKASSSYGEAVATASDDPVVLQNVVSYDIRTNRLNDAEAALRKLAGLGEKAPREVAWARRTLALIVAAAGNPKRVAEALDILGAAGGGGATPARGAPAVEDRRARVEILAAQPDRAQRREAIGILTGIVKEKQAAATDLLLLARLHDADGDWPRSREAYRALTAAHGQDPNTVAAYALALMRHNEIDEADRWAARLDELRPGSAEATELRARLLHARGRKPQAVALVEAFAKGKDDRSWTFARVLESLGENAAAEPLYRKAAVRPGQPVGRVGLITFLTRRGQTREALKLCTAAWDYLSPAEASALSVKVLTEGKATDPAAFERVASRLEQAIKANPDAPSIGFDLANLRTYQGKFDTAEAIYRKYSEKNPKVAAPLNNIAWLLALQDGKGAEALATIERAIAMDGDVPALLDTRAMAYLALGKPAEAIEDLDRAVASKPTADLYFHLARAYQAADRRREAAEALRKAKELGLAPAELHPLERPSYERLVAVMAKP